ncbi:glycosyltransferase family 1 protein [Halalkalibacter alkaliphilus]|uniref:Glycosyltransferase family 1 protein n=1 Tax=Halalkalibacter alkaliphilus TaxID=2917993 RepID=A0A9X2A3C9_9BACI|nr:glycosyltransferase family 1 protein [Halalkalibacter alkaliphilus]MCL7746072.1 glycosyltransferase family 1 protein [Halalkalibacter alkaliphilus]
MNARKPLKVLHVVGAMNRAGTETMLMNVFRNVNRTKVQFDFISYSQEDAHYDEEIKQLGGKVIKLSNTQSIKEMIEVMKKHGPYDVVHSHTLFHCGIANIAAKLAGVKVRIAHAHTTLDKSDSLIRKLYIHSMRTVISGVSTKLLACSNQAGSYLFGNKVVNSKKYSFFPNLIEYSTFLGDHKHAVTRFKKEAQLEDSFVIGHIGRFIEPKNHTFLLDILKSTLNKNSNTKLLLVGDGDLRKQIEEEAKAKGLYEHIRFVGLRDDIHTMLHSMDVFVFPSIYEGLGLVLLEAQACKVPCIVSEAIQPEADLHMNLLTKLKLADGPDIWAEKILEAANKVEKKKLDVTEAFEKSGYSLPVGIDNLMSIYQSQ